MAHRAPHDGGPLIAAFLGSPRQRELSYRSRVDRASGLRQLARFLHPRGLLDAERTDVERWLATGGSKAQRQTAARAFYMWAREEMGLAVDPARAPSEKVAERAPGVCEDARLKGDKRTEELFGIFCGRGLGSRSARIYANYTRHAERWMADQASSLDTAPAPLVAAYAENLPRSWGSRKGLRCALKHYWAATERPDPPLPAIRVPPKPRMVCRAPEEGDAAVLAQAAMARGDLKGLAVVLGIFQALRRAEIAALRWDQFHGDRLTLTGKGSVKAAIPVHPVVQRMLDNFDRKGDYIFPGRFGGPVTPATIWTWGRQVSEEAGLGLVSCHVWRHLALATALDATGDLRAVQDFARHADPKQTAGYTRTSGERMAAVVRAIAYDGPPRLRPASGDGR